MSTTVGSVGLLDISSLSPFEKGDAASERHLDIIIRVLFVAQWRVTLDNVKFYITLTMDDEPEDEAIEVLRSVQQVMRQLRKDIFCTRPFLNYVSTLLILSYLDLRKNIC